MKDINSIERKKFFLELAFQTAVTLSDDNNTQVGCVAINPIKEGKFICLGANQFPENVKNTPERLEKPTKYSYMEHAERSCMYGAAKHGLSLKNKWLFCTWFSCTDCTRAIIRSGISRVYGDKKLYDLTSNHWKENIKISLEMFKEAGVYYEYLDIPNLNRHGILFDGKIVE